MSGILAPTLLLIDDDVTLCELLSDHLRGSGYLVHTANSGPQGLSLAERQSPALIVLDVMMPGMDGWQVCDSLRSKSSVPIIMLTAKSSEMDKLRGFRLGIDDYVTKPFSFAELAARIGAVLARSAAVSTPNHTMSSGDLVIDFNQHRVTLAGQVVELTPTEYRVLETLARHPQRTLSTEQLLTEVWGPAYAGEVDQVKHFIWSLRKKVEVDPGDPRHLLTERGFGYRFE